MSRGLGDVYKRQTYPRIPKNHIDQVNVGFGRTTLTILTNLWIFVVGVGFGRTTLTILTNLWIFVVGVDIERTTRTKLTKYGFLWLVWFFKRSIPPDYGLCGLPLPLVFINFATLTAECRPFI